MLILKFNFNLDIYVVAFAKLFLKRINQNFTVQKVKNVATFQAESQNF